MLDIPRADYPRPHLQRKEWASLNGTWHFAFDDQDKGLVAGWQRTPATALTGATGSPFGGTIVVPFAYQSTLSGIGDRSPHGVVWYARTFVDPRKADRKEQDAVLLHFGAVDYEAVVWVNGERVAEHRGGHTPFHADITHSLNNDAQEHVVIVRVEDKPADLTLPRGKQYWRDKSESIFYTATTGIWQPVWLEPVPARQALDLDAILLRPDIDAGALQIDVGILGEYRDTLVEADVSLHGNHVASTTIRSVMSSALLSVSVLSPGAPPPEEHRDSLYTPHSLPPEVNRDAWAGMALWSPEHPTLYDVKLRLLDAGTKRVIDEVTTYAGMRKVSIEGGKFLLNNRPYFQRLVLDQGYWPGGLMTAPKDEDFKKDVEMMKELGFNGARKHQKVEDPRWLYWCDKLGFLVWGEMANAYEYSQQYVERFTSEWLQVIKRDRSHPCIGAWTPINESWGVPNLLQDEQQRSHLASLYHLTKSLDATRPVTDNDGWEHVESDLVTVHDYRGAPALAATYKSLDQILSGKQCGRPIFAPGSRYNGQPILLTEFGGLALSTNAQKGWGYETAGDTKEFLDRYTSMINAVMDSGLVQGFCWTQLSDIETEVNGLLTFDRRHKLNPEVVRRVTSRRAEAMGPALILM